MRQGCGNTATRQGLCAGHYQQVLRGSPVGPVKQRALCSFKGCAFTYHARGLCGGHYQQSRRGEGLTPLRPTLRSTTRDKAGNKRCSQCLKWKQVGEFYPDRGPTDGLNSYCRRCDRSLRIKRQYGITADQYDAMLAAQNGGCAICLRPPREASLHVDHDHACCPERKKSCGKCVRGLLCEDCNRALGMLGDDRDRIKRVLEYLG